MSYRFLAFLVLCLTAIIVSINQVDRDYSNYLKAVEEVDEHNAKVLKAKKDFKLIQQNSPLVTKLIYFCQKNGEEVNNLEGLSSCKTKAFNVLNLTDEREVLRYMYSPLRKYPIQKEK